MPESEKLMSFCRTCGGERHHSVIAEESRHWSEDDAPIDGGDRWFILECGGCHTITLVHEHYFSEDWEMGDDGPTPILHRDLYPPGPPRAIPEWTKHAWLDIPIDLIWIVKLHQDIYAAMGIKAFSLAAMGMRAIVDAVVTSKSGDKHNFVEKLEEIRDQGLITPAQVNILYAAFDAGSAASHRGYSPSAQDVYTLLDLTESLLNQIYIIPAQHRRHEKAAAALKANTPGRKP